MTFLSRTCFIFSLKCGAITTFMFSTVLNLIPLLSIPNVIKKVSKTIFFLNLGQVFIGIFAGILATVGSINNHPNLISLFITYYIGMLSIDLGSVIGTIALERPFYAHNVIRSGGKQRKKTSTSQAEWIEATFVFALLFLFRLYFTTIVYSFYKQLKTSQISESEEASIAESTESNSFESIHDQIE